MTRVYELEWLGPEHEYGLEEIRRRMDLDREFIIQCVEYGIARASGADLDQWRFTPRDVARMQRAWRLHRDLEIDVAGVGMVLDLLEDVADLRRQLNEVRRRLKHWES